MLTPEQIESREFLVSVRGYDRDEVHAFLREAAEHVRGLRDQLEAAIGDARAAEEMARDAEAQATAQRARADKAEAELAKQPLVVPTAADPASMFAEIGQQTQRILEAAAEAAEGIKQQAKRDAEQEIRKARRSADKLIAEGERRIEELQRGTTDLVRKREEVTQSLRAVARGLEQSLRELTLAEPPAATMREALSTAPEPEPVVEPEPVAEPQPEPVVEPQPDPEPVAADGPAPEAALPPGTGSLRAEALEPLHPKLVRKLKRGLQDLQNIAYERLRGTGGTPDPGAVLPPESEFAPLAGSVLEFLEQAYAAGAAAGARMAGREPAPATPPADLATEFGADMARQVNAPLAATLRMGVGGREQLPALTDRVAAVFGELKQTVADEISATHLVRAFEAGMHDAWAAGGIPARTWVMGREPRCPEARCRTNDQSGALRLSDPFPSGHLYPPVHPGCTCTTEPVTGGAE